MTEGLKMRIAGEITLSSTPGGTMKKWREIFGITQAELGKHLKISPSTISDYEGDRRKSPGIGVVHRFVNALIDLDAGKGGHVLAKFRESEEKTERLFEVHEFSAGISASDFVDAIDGKVIANEDALPAKKVYGYTLMDSLKVILMLPADEFPRLYGAMAERAFIFTRVSTGRSPMVVIRVTQTKPSVVVLHGLVQVDKLAIKIAERERIPVIVTKKEVDTLRQDLAKF
ncbi:MAG: helix-turn-helix domain-containing protein [Candidatus Micrarchaeota archaeon]|nr:helix-turn-helix domain-containing protein [Candidatus Micrarchaeota archaeon]